MRALRALLVAAAALLFLGVNTGAVYRSGQFNFSVFPPVAGNEGAPLYAIDRKRMYYNDSTSWAAFAVVDALDVIGQPEGSKSGNATRIAQTTFDGASFYAPISIRFNRIIFRVTGQSGAPTGRFLIYQSTAGSASSAVLLASAIAQPIGATGNFAVTVSQGLVNLQPGTFFILYGRDSAAGSFTMRTYTTQAVDLLNANVDTDTHPTAFTTTIASNTTPASIDPRSVPTGQLAGSSSDLTPVIRFKSL